MGRDALLEWLNAHHDANLHEVKPLRRILISNNGLAATKVLDLMMLIVPVWASFVLTVMRFSD